MDIADVVGIIKRHEAMWLERMNEPAKKGGLRDHATACLYRANALEEARREIEAKMKPACDFPKCFCAIKCDEI